MTLTKRRPARRGLSYLDANRGRLITVQDDVLGIKATIESRWPELEVLFDQEDDVWCIIEHCADGIDRLAIYPPTKYLDDRIIRRLEKADDRAPGAIDPLEAIDKDNAEVDRDQDRKFEDQVGDFGERLIHALRKDGYMDHEDVYGLRSKKHESNRAINRGKAVRV